MSRRIVAWSALLSSTLLLTAPLRADGFSVPTISPDEVRPGQKGYGLTVFAGVAPERFEAEVVGVIRDLQPGRSFILARLSGHGLEKSGVAAGMSGSPVYFDGRLAGAVAFGWPFSQEAIAGITPIDAMRGLDGAGAGVRSAQALGSRPLVGISDLAAGRAPADLLATELARIGSRLAPDGAGAPGALVWSSAGFADRSLAFLRTALGAVAPSGVGEPTAADLGPGGAVSAVVMDGDLRLAATGTVTDRAGDRLVAFGHPFLGLGAVSVPMAPAEIVTLFPSQYNSFKIANVGPVVGAVVQDRQPGIEGRIGAAASMFPVTVRMRGERKAEFRMRVADVPELSPSMIATAALAGLEAASRSGGAQTLDLAARFRLADRGEIAIRQTFDGDNASGEAVSYLLAVASYLAQNDLERLRIEGVEIDLEQGERATGATVAAVHAERTRLRPGERLRLHVDLKPLRAPSVRAVLDLPLPADLPPGRYTVWVGDGASIDAARMQLAPAEPETLDQALALLGSFHGRRELRALVAAARPGISTSGEAMPQLPGSVRSLWGAGSSLGRPLASAIVAEAGRSIDAPASGIERVEIEVRRQGSRAGDGADAAEGDPSEVAGSEAAESDASSSEAAGSKSRIGARPAGRDRLIDARAVDAGDLNGQDVAIVR